MHTAETRWTLARWLLGVPLGVFFLLHVLVVPQHLQDLDWPSHARHHALRAAFLGVALAVLGLWLVWRPLRSGTRSAWWLLVVVGCAAYGGFWTSTALVDYGQQGVDRWGSFAHELAQTVTYALGLAISYPPRQTASSTPRAGSPVARATAST
jgi:hypothetical protein